MCITLFASCGKKHEYTVGEKTKIELKSDSVVEVNDGVKTEKENIKVLFETEIDGEKAKICKYCNAAIKNSK